MRGCVCAAMCCYVCVCERGGGGTVAFSGLPASVSMAVFPPMLESTIASRVVGICVGENYSNAMVLVMSPIPKVVWGRG